MSNSKNWLRDKVCFAIMPMGEEFAEQARQRIEDVVVPIAKEEFGMKVVTPWELNEPALITPTVIQQLIKAEVVVADVTGANANVFYELAVRHALQRPCVQIQEAGADLPFNVFTMRTIAIGPAHRDVLKAQAEFRSQLAEIELEPNRVFKNPLGTSFDLEEMKKGARDAKDGLGAVVEMLSEVKQANHFLGERLERTGDTIIGEIQKLETGNVKIRDQLARGIVETTEGVFRALRYDVKNGTVYYGNRAEGGQRNILFNNETIKVILGEIRDAKCDGHPIEIDGKPILNQIGYKSSTRFAKHFVAYMRRKFPDVHNLNQWLHRWKEYDSAAGFGFVDIEKPDESEQKWVNSVAVQNSFLTHNASTSGKREAEESSLCGFLVGYLQGLLDAFPDDLFERRGLDPESIQVTHSWDGCTLKHGNPGKGCQYRIEVRAASPSA